jgi:transcriptional regulator with XRE-family HTH domain
MEGRRDAFLNPSNIRLMRMKKEILQTDIAEKLGMSLSTFGAVERGKRLVKQPVVKQLSEILNAPPAKLFKPGHLKKKFVAVIVRPAV